MRICETLLGSTEVSPLDNFLEIGGDSLMSIKLVALSREQGLNISPGDVFESATISDLAARSDASTVQQAVTRDPEPPRIDRRLSTLRAGEGAGSILCVHEIGGKCHYAHYMTDFLVPGMQMFAAQQGISPENSGSFESIEDLAKRYIAEWMDQDPDGPWIVIGYCWGALLAYEAAQQMRRAGKTVQLVILEGASDRSFQFVPPLRRAVAWCRGLRLRVATRMSSIFRQRHRSADTNGEQLTEHVINGFRYAASTGDPRQIEVNLKAWFDYSLRPLAGSLNLYATSAATNLIGGRYISSTHGWEYVCMERLSLYEIPGNHDSCIRPPHAKAVAEIINESLKPGTHTKVLG